MSFVEELHALMEKHRVWIDGTVRLRDLNENRWIGHELKLEQEIKQGPITDRTGPFLIGSVTEKPWQATEIKPFKRIHVASDIAGYDCPVTGNWIDGKREHRENLKRQGCRNLEPGETREAQKRIERETNDHCKQMARQMVRTAVSQLDL